LAGGGLAILLALLTRKHQFADPAESFGQRVTSREAVRVRLAHGSLGNRLAPAAEQHNMISDTRADEGCLDYLALGAKRHPSAHLKRPQRTPNWPG